MAEVSNAAWKYVKAGVIDSGVGKCVFERAVRLVDTFETSLILYREAYVLSGEYMHPVYDALYLVLVRRNNAVLAALDQRLFALASKLKIKTA